MENSFNVTLRTGFAIIALAMAVGIVSGCRYTSHQYQAAPITGQVIDKETGKSLEGVHVAVYWQLYDESNILGGLGGRVATDVIGVSETITDKDGYYHIPGWGPEVVSGNYLGEESPMIGFYKSGYKFRQLYNSNMTLLVTKDYISEKHEYSKQETEKGDVYTSTWDGVVIELERQSDDVQKRIYNLQNAHRFIRSILWGKGCESKSIKNFILAYSKEAKEVKDKDPEKYKHKYFSTIERHYDNNCGQVRDILEEDALEK